MDNENPVIYETSLAEDGSVTVIVDNDTWATAQDLQAFYTMVQQELVIAKQEREALVELQGYTVGLQACLIGAILVLLLFRRL